MIKVATAQLLTEDIKLMRGIGIKDVSGLTKPSNLK